MDAVLTVDVPTKGMKVVEIVLFFFFFFFFFPIMIFPQVLSSFTSTFSSVVSVVGIVVTVFSVPDYNPLTGGGGACYRPSRRGPTGGG